MSDMSINLSMGGAFYRASQNSAKVNRAVNQMLNRLETGQKYQYAYQNVSAVTQRPARVRLVHEHVANDARQSACVT